MILLFSGTGNTRRVAELLRNDGEQVIEMTRIPDAPLKVKEGERVVGMFPVYAWGMPRPVSRFIKSAIIESDAPHYMVCTCGDDIGLTHIDWRRCIVRRGWRPVATFSVAMPNTYVLLPGFDVDPHDVVEAKLSALPARVDKIARAIRHGVRVDDVVPGAMAWIKSRILRPLFNAFLMSPKPFKALPACVGCGRCARKCPMQNITMSNLTGGSPTPVWGKNCAMCLACYHGCPYHAVAYGSSTRHKGQYSGPMDVK